MAYDPFDGVLEEAILLRRYKRFLADIALADGRQVTAHCANSGSMLGMNQPGSKALVRHVSDPKRKLKWTLEAVWPPHAHCWIGCNTAQPNHVVEAAIVAGAIPGLSATTSLRREVPYGTNSRVDLVADGVYVEVKNTTLAAPPGVADEKPLLDAPELAPSGNVAYFPDAVTSRGAKHMDELAAVVDAGGEAAVVFLVNRADCDSFAVARNIDPAYAAAFDRAEAAGVRMIPLGACIGPAGWTFRGVLPRADA